MRKWKFFTQIKIRCSNKEAPSNSFKSRRKKEDEITKKNGAEISRIVRNQVVVINGGREIVIVNNVTRQFSTTFYLQHFSNAEYCILIWFDSIKVNCGSGQKSLMFFFYVYSTVSHVSVYVYPYWTCHSYKTKAYSVRVQLHSIRHNWKLINFPVSIPFVVSFAAIIYILFIQALFSPAPSPSRRVDAYAS